LRIIPIDMHSILISGSYEIQLNKRGKMMAIIVAKTWKKIKRKN